MAQVLAAKPLVDSIIANLQHECQSLKQKPLLHVFLVGQHPPSVIYTRNKKKFIEKLGGECEIIQLDESISEQDFLARVQESATNSRVSGLFVQLPLPQQLKHIDVGQIVPAYKDVDGFHADNLYKVMTGDLTDALVSCTPKGIMSLLDFYDVNLEGKHAVVLGRSMIVGKPIALLLSNANATVTLCHSRTKNVKEITKSADIIISAVGKAQFFDDSYLKDGQDVTLIDVGINHDDHGALCGDINFEKVQSCCKGISPVPGGVGPLTIASLGQNLIQAAKRQQETNEA